MNLLLHKNDSVSVSKRTEEKALIYKTSSLDF